VAARLAVTKIELGVPAGTRRLLFSCQMNTGLISIDPQWSMNNSFDEGE
jgi:hypothetical protein